MPSGRSSARTSDAAFNLHWLTYLKGRALTDNEWYYNELTCLIQARIRVANSQVFYCDIPVCSSSSPRHGAFAIKQRGGGLWYLSPSIYLQGRDEKTWLAKSKAIHPLLGSTFLVLSSAPDKVDEALMSLSK